LDLDLAVAAAQALRLFEQAGLEVDFHAVPDPYELSAGLKTGRWQVVHVDADHVFHWGDDPDCDCFIFLIGSTGFGTSLWVRPGVADPSARRLAVDDLEAGEGLWLQDLLLHQGLPGRAVALNPPVSPETRLDLLREGHIDGCFLPASLDLEAAEAGLTRQADLGTQLPEYPGYTLATTHRFNAVHPEQVITYARVIWQALGRAVEMDPSSEGPALLAKAFGWPSAVAARRFPGCIKALGRVHPSLSQAYASLELARALRTRHRAGVGRVQRYFDPAVMNAMF
jgi:hypothetical protein